MAILMQAFLDLCGVVAVAVIVTSIIKAAPFIGSLFEDAE